jgi:hypothetical protein
MRANKVDTFLVGEAFMRAAGRVRNWRVCLPEQMQAASGQELRWQQRLNNLHARHAPTRRGCRVGGAATLVGA